MMNNYFALVWEDTGDNTEQIDILLKHLSTHTKFFIPQNVSSNNEIVLAKIGSFSDAATPSIKYENSCDIGFTFYVNTDLNDLGRSLDVREPVNHILNDFIGDWLKNLD